MTIETARRFFLFCSVINYVVLIVWAVPVMFWRDRFYRLWSVWFRFSPEQLDMINVGGMSLYKIGIILFNIVPCIALYLV